MVTAVGLISGRDDELECTVAVQNWSSPVGSEAEPPDEHPTLSQRSDLNTGRYRNFGSWR